MIENTWEEQVERLNARVAELLAERDQLRDRLESARKALEFYADTTNWQIGRRCDPNSSRFDGTQVAQDALLSLTDEKEKS
jgi:hypothetical protein